MSIGNQVSASRELNAYEAKMEAKRERLKTRAEVANAEAVRLSEKAYDMMQQIPPGQPILTDHYSAAGHRRHLSKMQSTYEKSAALSAQAQALEHRAEGVGTGGISSDDPDAIKKLQEKLVGLESAQTLMVAANKLMRTHKTPETCLPALIAAGMTEEQAKDAMRFGLNLAGGSAEIRRVKARIETLEKAKTRATVELAGDGFICRQDVAENRLMFIFEGKPGEAIRAILKRWGFKWSPTRSAWIRQLNNAGTVAATQVLASLKAAKTGDEH